MDLLTQIVLGAACGEAVLGRKIGNKALLFGAIGGIIPDLDVALGNILYGNAIDSMLFHRGFMHSVLFSVLGGLVLGWLVHKLYDSGRRMGSTTREEWMFLVFVTLFTHIILDCFTPYGTQLFAPFSDYRVAFNNIAVVDLFYTIPFLISVIVLMWFKRRSRTRRLWLRWGLIISSSYMLITLINKLYIDSIFKKSLIDSEIAFTRFSTQPSLLNNVLWYGIAETEASYHVAYYSLFDRENRFLNWRTLAKQRDLKPSEYKDIQSLALFSNQYYTVYELDNQTYRYNDLRYPVLETEASNTSVFNLTLFKENTRLNMEPFEPQVDELYAALAAIWQRAKGI